MDVRARRRERIEAYLDRLFGYALSLTKDRSRAQDLVQTCALKSLSTERIPVDEPAYRAWLFKILRNTFLDDLRKQRDNALLIDDDDQCEERHGNNVFALNVSTVDQSVINTLAVREVLTRLSRTHREVLVLIDMVGFSYKEAACLLKVPTGTVMSRLSRARKVMLHELSERKCGVSCVGLRAVRSERQIELGNNKLLRGRGAVSLGRR